MSQSILAHREGPLEESRKLASFGGNFDVVEISEGRFAITDGHDHYKALSAFHDHPYCRESEDLFLYAMTDPFAIENFPEQTIKIYLRNDRTFQVQVVTFKADIIVKQDGVHSGIIINPPELAGLLVAPDPDHPTTWIVTRPLKMKNVGKLDRKAVKDGLKRDHNFVPAHIKRLPNIHFRNTNLADGLEGSEMQDPSQLQLKSGAIFNSRERNSYLKQSGNVWLAEGALVENGSEIRFKLTVKDKSQLPELPAKVVLVGPSPFYWPKIINNIYSFTYATKDHFQYFELTFADIVEEDGNFFAVPDKRPSFPDQLSLYFFREGETSEIAQTTRALALSV